MTFWDADQLNGSDVEQMYGRWEGHQRNWHDQIELGQRVADALLAENK